MQKHTTTDFAILRLVSSFIACADNDEEQWKRVKQCRYARHGHIFGQPTGMVSNLGLTHLVEERMTRRRLSMTEATISATIERPVKYSFCAYNCSSPVPVEHVLCTCTVYGHAATTPFNAQPCFKWLSIAYTWKLRVDILFYINSILV